MELPSSPISMCNFSLCYCILTIFFVLHCSLGSKLHSLHSFSHVYLLSLYNADVDGISMMLRIQRIH